MDNIFKIDGGLISLSEQQSDPSRKIAKFLLCPLDEPNLNKKGIKESDLTEDEMKTLIGQPLVTKLIFNEKTKQYDFSGHLMKKVYKVNNEGNLVQFSDFTSTNPIGYHTNIEIEDIEIDGVIKRCLVATVVLWTRYYKSMEVIERIGANLRTSWELSYSESYEENGTTWLKGILFLANCVLGSNIKPAYKVAGLLECAEEDLENELAEAMLQDINDLNQIQNQTDENSVDDKLNNIEGGHEEMAEENKENIESSSLTMEDLYTKVRKAIRKATEEDKWYYISYLYPLEFRTIAHSYEDSETKFVEFTYSVSEDGVVSVTSQKDVEMVFIPKEESEQAIAEIKQELEKANTSLSEKVGEIVKLGEVIKANEETISAKDVEISTLQPFKVQIEQSQAEEKEKEVANKKLELSEMLIATKYFTKEEVETSEEIKNAISELDESLLNKIIASRVVEQATKQTEEKKEVEVSEVKNTEVSTDLNAGQEYNYSKSGNVLLDFINKKSRKKY